jgi:hypothetical protein
LKKIIFSFLALICLALGLLELAKGGFPLLSYLHRLNHLSEETIPGENGKTKTLVKPSKLLAKETLTPLTLGQEKFSTLLETVLIAIPDREATIKNSADLSYAPSEFHKLGPKLGEIADAVDKNPDLAPQALDFYENCTRREDTFNAVRAVCLWNLRRLSRKTGHPDLIDEANYPVKVREVADSLSPRD